MRAIRQILIDLALKRIKPRYETIVQKAIYHYEEMERRFAAAAESRAASAADPADQVLAEKAARDAEAALLARASFLYHMRHRIGLDLANGKDIGANDMWQLVAVRIRNRDTGWSDVTEKYVKVASGSFPEVNNVENLP